MGHPDLDLMIEMQRRRDEMAEAAHYRLVKEAKLAARMGAERQPIWLMRLVDQMLLVMAWGLSFMGARLLKWGCRLQTRYEIMSGVVTENGPSPCG